MDLEKEILPSDRLNKRLEKYELDIENYYYQNLMTNAFKSCLDKCIVNQKSSLLGTRDKICFKNCTNAFQHVSTSTFFSMNSALVLKDMESEARNKLNTDNFSLT